MNCVELEQSLAEVDDGSSAEQRAHLRACPACSALVKELNSIIEAAANLQAADEPSPRVWNSIEIALRKEGLIRPQRPPISSFGARWGAVRWLVPAAAMLLLSLGLYLHQQQTPNQFAVHEVTAPAAVVKTPDLNDDELMQVVAENAPAMKIQYAENLRQVNQSIRDAQGLVQESPNDEDARSLLMVAYEQKAMLFQLAMDRSLQ
jgi:hypothetical protein